MNEEIFVIREYYNRRVAALNTLGVAIPNDLERIGTLLEYMEAAQKLPDQWRKNTKHMKFTGAKAAIQEACNCANDLEQTLRTRPVA